MLLIADLVLNRVGIGNWLHQGMHSTNEVHRHNFYTLRDNFWNSNGKGFLTVVCVADKRI